MRVVLVLLFAVCVSSRKTPEKEVESTEQESLNQNYQPSNSTKEEDSDLFSMFTAMIDNLKDGLDDMKDTLIKRTESCQEKNPRMKVGSCPYSFEEIGGCCYLFSTQEATWMDARKECQDIGDSFNDDVDLAEVGTVDACHGTELMETISSKRRSYWFGASDAISEGIWEWAETRKILSLTNNMWNHDDPDGSTTQNCLLAGIYPLYRFRAYFSDVRCLSKYRYICQKFN